MRKNLIMIIKEEFLKMGESPDISLKLYGNHLRKLDVHILMVNIKLIIMLIIFAAIISLLVIIMVIILLM